MYKPETKKECLIQNIKLFCSTNNLTNTDFAILVGISDATLNNWLHGTSMPDPTRQAALEKVLDAKYDKICSNIITTRLLLDYSLTLEDIFPYNCILSAFLDHCAGKNALLNYEDSPMAEFDLNYRKISPEDFDKIFKTYSYREQMITEMRYRDSLTLDEVAKKVGLTRERIRQIECKTLHKLYYDLRNLINNEKPEIERLRYENEQLKQYITALESAKSVSEVVVKPAIIPSVKLNTPIEDFDFSVRTYNCLKRAQLNTIQDIVNYKSGLMNIRNLGRKGVDEIITTIEDLHIGYRYDLDAHKFVLLEISELPGYSE